jgi:hypothetical protein
MKRKSEKRDLLRGLKSSEILNLKDDMVQSVLNAPQIRSSLKLSSLLDLETI